MENAGSEANFTENRELQTGIRFFLPPPAAKVKWQSGNQLVARSPQSVKRNRRMLFLDQDVVGVERGDRKDGHAALRQWIEERGQHTCQCERKRPLQFEAGPRRLTSRSEE